MDVAQVLQTLQKLPKKEFGQHFLVNDEVLQTIVETAGLTADDTVIEIGPGLGALTAQLTARAGRVIAIEADRDLAEFLRRKNIDNLTVVTGDALQIDWTATLKGSYKIVANIPYSITSPLLRKIFSLPNQPTETVLLIQKEVAERLSAKAGNNDRGFLTLLIEAVADVRIVSTVPPDSFYPVPKVDSAVVALVPRRQPLTNSIFWPAVEAAFRHKRQMISNSLNDLPIPKDKIRACIEKADLKATARPAELSLEQWQVLSTVLTKEIG